MATRKSAATDYAEQVATRLIDQLKEGTAPWQKPWKAGELERPHNPLTGAKYRGMNNLYLHMQPYDDPRWVTYKQAQAQGWQVRKGEKGTPLQYLKREDRRKLLDDDGKPVLNSEGKAMYQVVQLERPRLMRFVVFNAEQIDGIPAREIPEPAQWDRQEEVEAVLQASGVPVNEKVGDRAFYSPSKDQITIPLRSQFDTPDAFYAVALHELGHATGHKSRLDRDLTGPFGSVSYAKEELRAEIASLMLGEEFGVGHDPGQHAAYVKSWVSVLEDDPLEIVRACNDAEQIRGWVMALQQTQEQELDQEQTMEKTDQQKETTGPAVEPEKQVSDVRQNISVPFRDKDEAKTLGARWDRDEKTWYVPPGGDLTKFDKWMPGQEQRGEGPEPLAPEQEFAQALDAAGIRLTAATSDSRGLPIMDGKFRRVPVEGDKPGQLGGGYVGHLDGVCPAGYILNYREDIKENWKSQRPVEALSSVDRQRQQQEAKERQLERQKARDDAHLATSKRLAGEITDPALYKPADPDHAYLRSKGLDGNASQLLQDAKGNLVVTAHDVEGRLWTVQRIGRRGWKGFEAEGKREGTFHINRQSKSDQAPIVVAEGWATAETCNRELAGQDAMVVTAFVHGNLGKVAQSLRERFPERPILIAADNDYKNKVNVGVKSAKKAAEQVGGHWVAPPDGLRNKDGSVGTDFNDMAQVADKNAVKQLLAEALIISERRRLVDAQQLGQGAEQVAARVQHTKDRVERIGGDGLTIQRSRIDQERTRAKVEVDKQDSSDQRVDPNEPEAVKRRIGRGRKLS